MYNVIEEKNFIRFQISSELQLVDRVIMETQAFLKQYQIENWSNFKLVLREILNNAIEHGNKHQIEKKVTCSINYLTPGNGKTKSSALRYRVDVEDEGVGFNYNELDLTFPDDPKQIRNRGFSLINAFSDEIQFNIQGNKIGVFMTFTNETDFEVKKIEKYQIITPNGSLTAAVADKFREILKRLHGSGNYFFKLDLRNVEDIDSVCLSVLILLAKTISKESKYKGKNENREYDLRILNANNDLVELFQLTRMNEIYHINN